MLSNNNILLSKVTENSLLLITTFLCQSHHQLQGALDVDLLKLVPLCKSALTGWRLVRPAADDDFDIFVY